MALGALTLLLVFTAARAGSEGDFVPVCENNYPPFIAHPHNCSVFYRCAGNTPFLFVCPHPTVFDDRISVCNWEVNVPRCNGSSQTSTTTPTTTTTTMSLADRCAEDPTAVFPHPTECHQFYNCSLFRKFSYYFSEDHLDECPYPQLFDAQTLQCAPYDTVECGDRTERFDACDYVRNTCPRSHCIPCHYRFPSCKDREDGNNVYRNYEWTRRYVVCKDQRPADDGSCEYDHDLDMTSVFSPESRRCVSLYEVPREKRGHLLNCTGREDGAHPDDATHRPNLYFRCQDGQRTHIGLCPPGYIYGDLDTACIDRVSEFCQGNHTALLPHPDECQLFYNCSKVWEPAPPHYFTQHMDECPYPLLFSLDTLDCEHYADVSCGQRKEIVDYCEYRRIKYSYGHMGPPCTVHNPSCKGMEDGANVYQDREWTPYFIYCQDQRFNGTSATCARDDYLSIAQFFSPLTRECVSLYDVPRNINGGYLLDCKDGENNKPDGFYPDDATGRENLYYSCENGERQEIKLCPDGQVYGDLTTPCQPHQFQSLPPN